MSTKKSKINKRFITKMMRNIRSFTIDVIYFKIFCAITSFTFSTRTHNSMIFSNITVRCSSIFPLLLNSFASFSRRYSIIIKNFQNSSIINISNISNLSNGFSTFIKRNNFFTFISQHSMKLKFSLTRNRTYYGSRKSILRNIRFRSTNFAIKIFSFFNHINIVSQSL